MYIYIFYKPSIMNKILIGMDISRNIHSPAPATFAQK